MRNAFDDAIHIFWLDNGKMPDKMFLGNQEWMDLKGIAESHNFHYFLQSSPEYREIKVYVVSEGSHLDMV